MTNKELMDEDLKHIFHPCSQMKDYETLTPITIDRAEGSYLYDKTGKSYIDAISSWWCKSLGHQHPRLKQALIEQTEKFEHVILANSTNDAIETLLAVGPPKNAGGNCHTVAAQLIIGVFCWMGTFRCRRKETEQYAI